MQALYIGVDGGATKVVVRVEDEAGNLLGIETGGPANIRLSVTQAWASIHQALEKIIQTLGKPIKEYELHAGMGIAGCEIESAYQAFLAQAHGFKTLLVTSDAHTACVGAHGGADGAIIIIGTGVVGFQIQGANTNKISGWGFPYDDIGGGAWLGLEAIKITLQWMDGRLPESGLGNAIDTYFNHHLEQLLVWANEANSTAYAALAPIVIQQSETGDAVATDLIRQAAHAIDMIGVALDKQVADLPCALIGGIAPFVAPYLSETLRSRLVPCVVSPEAGAILLIRSRQHFISP